LKTRQRAFTLLEIMVAVAILGLSLTVILSAQAGLYAGGAYAQRTSLATGLLRCRMAEIEERMMKLGFPETEDKDDGACCEDDLRQDLRCEWKIERIELPTPDSSGMSSADGGSSSSGTTGGGPLSALMGLGGGATGAPGGMGAMGAMGALGQMGLGGSGLALSGDAGVAGLASALKSGTGGGMSALAQLAMGIVYPTLKPMLEASTRKITVKVKWKEGVNEREVSAIQFVTRPMRGDAITAMMMGSADGGVPALPTNPMNPMNQIPRIGP
jgi:general secretion pathway protein I